MIESSQWRELGEPGPGGSGTVLSVFGEQLPVQSDFSAGVHVHACV